MRGHGESEGNYDDLTNQDFLEDVIGAYDYLARLDYVDKNNISAIGSSFGGYLIAILSAKRKIKNLALRVPANYPDEMMDQIKSSYDYDKLFAWRKKILKARESQATSALNKFKGKILIIQAELDDRVSPETIQNYMNAIKDKSKLTHMLMKGAPHSVKEGKFKDWVEQILLYWFKNL
jgi:esterase/lipase